MKAVTTWILIADGARARFFENKGPGKGLAPVRDHDFEQAALQARDIVSDKPGRAFSSGGDGRSAMEPPTDPVDKREDDFTRLIAGKLAEVVQHNRFDRLVIAAAPEALGNLRTHMNAHVRDKITAELDKDLTNIPAPDLPKHFDDVMRL